MSYDPMTALTGSSQVTRFPHTSLTSGSILSDGQDVSLDCVFDRDLQLFIGHHLEGPSIDISMQIGLGFVVLDDVIR